MPVVPLWIRLLVYLGCVLLVVSVLKGCHDSLVAKGYTLGETHEREQWLQAERKRQDDEAAERARLDKQKELSDRETRRLNDLAQSARAAADAAAGRLRRDLAAAVAAAKRADPPAIGQRPAADSALDLLAVLFNRADDTAGDLAQYADRARIAGQQCERDYDALKNSQLSPPSPGSASAGSP
jgi:hypothetical protein